MSTAGSRILGFGIIGGLFFLNCYLFQGAQQACVEFEAKKIAEFPTSSQTLLKLVGPAKYRVYRQVPYQIFTRRSRYSSYWRSSSRRAPQRVVFVEQKTGQILSVDTPLFPGSGGRSELGTIYVSKTGLYSVTTTPASANGSIVITRF